jgi:hypothetical protein
MNNNNNNKRKRTTTTRTRKKKSKRSDARETLSEIGPFRIPNFREVGEAEEKEGTLELTARTVAHVAREIVKFLLFNRNQIPLVFDDLLSLRLLRREEEEEEEEETEEEEENATTKKKRKRKSKKKSSKRSEKKLSNQIAQVERALMESLSEEEFASRRPVKRVAVCFGATANRPVETYIIDLEDVRYSARGIEEEEEEEEEEAMREKKTKSAANRIVRAVMPHVAGLRTNPSRTSQKIWIFLRHEDTTSDIDDENDEKSAPKIETSNLFAMKRNLDGLFGHEEEGEEDDKRGKRKNVKGNVFARIVLKSSSKPSSVLVPTPSCSWYQSRLVPKGFRFKETVR